MQYRPVDGGDPPALGLARKAAVLRAEYAQEVEDSEQAVLTGMLQSAEDAAPVQAVEAVTGVIATALNARGVSLLIADLSGRALVRLTHQPDGGGTG